MALKVRKNGAWVDIADIGGITYDLLGGGTAGGAGTFGTGVGKIILRPSSGDDDEVSITGGSNIRIDGNSATGFTINADTGSSDVADKIQEGNTKAEVIDTGTDGRFLIEIDGVEALRVDNQRHLVLKPSGMTNLEGGHLQFENPVGNTDYGIDVYSNNGTEASSVLRIIDEVTRSGSTGTQRFCVNRSGALAMGHTGAEDYGTSGYALVSQGASAPPKWEDLSAGAATTFLSLGDTPANYTGQAHKLVRVNKAGSSSNGTALEFISETTYALSAVDGDDAASEKIRLTPTSGTTSDVTLKVINGLSIARTNNLITIDGAGAGTNTTYNLKLSGSNGDNGQAVWTLDGTSGTDTTVTLKAGNNISISSLSGTGSGTSGEFQIDAAGPDADTYSLPVTASGNDIKLSLTPADGTTPAANQVVTIEKGNNVTLTKTTGNNFKIDVDASSITGTTYQLKATRAADGGSTGDDDDPYLFLDASGSQTDSSVRLVGSGSVEVTRNNAGNIITINGTGSGTGTTYTLPVFGTSNGSSGIKLTPDGGTASSAQTINITGSGNISVTGSGQTLTIDGGSISGTTYDLSALLSPGIKLTGSDGSTDNIFFDSDSTISITRTVAPGSTGGGTLHFSAATQAGTTYQLQGGGTNSSTFPGGTGTINLKTGGSIQDTVTVTAGDNIRIDTTGVGGFKIHADDVGSTAFKLKNSGGGGNSAAVFELYPSGGSGSSEQKITITPGTGIEFTNTTQGLIIQSDGSSSTLNVSTPTNQSGPLLFVTSTGNNKTVYGDTALTWNAGTDTLNIGANSSDKVAINADVSTHIYPSANESFDIGESPTNRWRKLYVKEVEADLILGSFSINTNDEEVLFTDVSGSSKVVAGSSKFKFDGNQLQISNTGNNNFVHLTQDGGVEICRSNASTGGSGGAYVDFKDGTSDDYDSRIQLITSSANGNANSNLPGGLQFICGVNKPKAVVTTEGVFGISGSEEISNSTGGFCPGRPPNEPWGNSQDWVADVNGQVYVRRAGTSGNEGGHITLQDGDKGRGWSIDCYRGNNQSSGDRSRFRILSENSIANTGSRADQLFCMNRNGAVAWGGHKDNSNWPSGGDGHGNEDYGSSGAVLMSRGSDKPPIWSSTGSVSPEFSSPLKLARDNSTGEGGGILLAKSNSSSFVAGWEIDCNGTTSNPDYRVIDSSVGQVRFGVQGASGAICVGQMGNWGQNGQVIMSQGSGNVSTYSHKPTSGAWWHSSKQTVPTIHTDGVMEIGKYLDFHATQTVANDYSARIENRASTPTALLVRNYIQQYSDSRVKDNLVAISSPLDKVGIITGYTYNYTNTGEESPSRTGGVIAQDVEKVLPELIHDSSDGFKTLNYNGIAALLVEAVKELKAKNTALEARIAALESS